MKRKLPSTLTPIHIPGGSSSTTSFEALARHFVSPSELDIMSPPSQYISRRSLSPATDRALKNACQAFAKYNNCEEEAVKLDFTLVHQQHKSTKDVHSSSRHYKQSNDGYALRKMESAQPRTHNQRVEACGEYQYAQAVRIGRRRDSPPQSSGHQSKDQHATERGRTQERFKPIGSYAMNDSDDSISTPRTGSSERQYMNASTAMTSAAALSPKLQSKRDSRRKEKESAAEAVHNIFAARRRQESAQASQQVSQQPSARPSMDAGSRSLSRTRSIRDGLRNYMRPRSRASQESLRDDAVKDPSRSSSSQGWRNWGLRRKGSKGSLTGSRPDSANPDAHSDASDPSKPAVDLNRELPPLPGLDQWKPEPEPEPEPEVDEPTLVMPHISQLMVSPKPDLQSAESAPAPSASPPRTGIVHAGRNKHHPINTSRDNYPVKSPQQKPPKRESKAFRMPSFSKFDFESMLASPDHKPPSTAQPISPAPHARKQPSVDIFAVASTPMHTKISVDQPRSEYRSTTPNFSRKMSRDVPRPIPQDSFGPFTEITGGAPEKQHKGFRKAFVGLFTTKKGSVNSKNLSDSYRSVSSEEAASAPIVKYS